MRLILISAKKGKIKNNEKTQRLSGAYTSAPARIYKCLVWFDSDTHSGSWIYQNPLNSSTK